MAAEMRVYKYRIDGKLYVLRELETATGKKTVALPYRHDAKPFAISDRKDFVPAFID